MKIAKLLIVMIMIVTMVLVVVVVEMLTMRKRVLLQEGLVSRGLVCEIHRTLETQVLSIILSTAQFLYQNLN